VRYEIILVEVEASSGYSADDGVKVRNRMSGIGISARLLIRFAPVS
jgi:hypothetical protein